MPHKHADMQIYSNFTEWIEEAYDRHYVCFVDRTHSLVKAAKKLYSLTFSTRSTRGEVLWSSGVEKNRKINERPPQLLGT